LTIAPRIVLEAGHRRFRSRASSQATAILAAALLLLDTAAAILHRRSSRDPDARPVVGDLCCPLPSRPFDAIISTLAIYHLDRRDKHGGGALLPPTGLRRYRRSAP
jgi:hypothetical protein